MAVGLPLKTTYVDGDVFSASDINDTNGTVNLFQTSTLSQSAGKNPVINGGFDIWQRGTSIAGGASNTYTADRWQIINVSTYTVSRQATGDTTNLPNIRYCARVQRNNLSAATTLTIFASSIETANSIPLSGKQVTLSFYARKGANFSAASNLLTVYLGSGTGTDQNIMSGYTGISDVINTTATLTSTWQRFTYTATVPSDSSELGLQFYYTPTGVAGASDFFEITGVQLELGANVTSFSRAGGTIQGELAACQRYYIRTTGGSSTGNSMGFQSQATTTTIVDFMIAPQVSMRTYPTSVDYSNIGVYRYANATNYSGGTITMYLNSNITNTIIARYTHGSAIFAINDGVAMNSGSNAATYIGFSAEL